MDIAVIDATHTIHQALRAEAWTPHQRQRLRQLSAGTLPQAASGATPGRLCHGPGHPATEIAIYPDVIRLATHTLRAPDTGHRAGP